MNEEHSDSPAHPQTECEEHVEPASLADDMDSDLIPDALGEAAAAARGPRAPAPPRKGKRPAKGQILGFLCMDRLPADDSSGAAPVATWIAVQLLAIAASAGRWKFWASEGAGNAPAIELLALNTLVVVQLAASTLLYPILLDSWTKLAWSVATLIAFDAIAWVMTDVAPPAAAWTGAFVVAWMVGLACWRSAARGAFATMLIRLLLAMVVLGWPIVLYLHGEFSATGNGRFGGLGGGGPIVIAVAQLQSPALAMQTWVTAVIIGGSGGIAWWVRWWAARQSKRAVAGGELPRHP